MLFYFEGFTLLFQQNAQINIQSRVFFCQFGIVSVLYKSAGKSSVRFYINIITHKLSIKVFYSEELTLSVDHRLFLSLFVYHKQRNDTRLLCYTVVIRTKSRSNVHYTRTIFCCNIITAYYSERISHRSDKIHQLLIVKSYQVGTFALCKNLERYILIAFFVFFESQSCILFRTISIQTSLCHNNNFQIS